MRYAFLRYLLFGCLLSGCFYFGKEQWEDVIRHPSSEWSPRDCLTIIMSVMQHNFYDVDNQIKVIATPYYPSVIQAMKRREQYYRSWTDSMYRESVDSLTHYALGMHVDSSKEIFRTQSGKDFRGPLQLDSLLFLVTLHNDSWPSYSPEIYNLENNIFLVNDREKYMRPLSVWGRRQNEFSMDETLLVMFILRGGTYHFLTGSENMYLVIKGFDRNIRLTFPLSRVR